MGPCGQFKIQSKSDFESCRNKCRDEERDQMKSCTGAGCQGGAGTAACLGRCDDGQKAAQQAKCYKDQ
jgi:hydroxyethylthiazole kinase-like sugar kinase family protein